MISQTAEHFFSGFSLNNEKELFNDYITINNYTVAGFSHGAQKAFEYALNTDKRIDKLQLFSPAFFQNNDKKYKRMQLMFFKKDPTSYCDNFLLNCANPNNISLKEYFSIGTYEELEDLLYYEWDENKLNELLKKNIKIEVFLGTDDKIINSQKTKDFFTKYSTVYFIKNVGHILT